MGTAAGTETRCGAIYTGHKIVPVVIFLPLLQLCLVSLTTRCSDWKTATQVQHAVWPCESPAGGRSLPPAVWPGLRGHLDGGRLLVWSLGRGKTGACWLVASGKSRYMQAGRLERYLVATGRILDWLGSDIWHRSLFFFFFSCSRNTPPLTPSLSPNLSLAIPLRTPRSFRVRLRAR